jgi:subtilisin family serine protease
MHRKLLTSIIISVLILILQNSRAGVFVKFDNTRKQEIYKLREEIIQDGAKKIRDYPNLGWELWDAPEGESDSSFLAFFKLKKIVLNVSLSARFELFDTFPNDTDFLSWQWPLYSENYPDSDMDAYKAWDITTGTKDIIIAVIDTGIDFTHPDLTSNLWQNKAEIPNNGVDDDGNGFVDDYFGWDFVNNINLPYDPLGHGTHVSGIISATGNNSTGISGVSWNSQIMTLKVFEERETSDEIILAAFDYLLGLDQKIHVINASWGGSEYSEAMKDAFTACKNKGIFISVAAGNDKMNSIEHPVYPARFNFSNMVSAAASDVYGKKWNSSNYGAAVSICAPGKNVHSTLPSPYMYGRSSGTSMAAPQASGAAALLLSLEKNLSPEIIRDRMIACAEASVALKDVSISRGLLNLNNLLKTHSGKAAPVTDLSVKNIGLTTATLQFTLPEWSGIYNKTKIMEMRYAAWKISGQNWWKANPVNVFIDNGNPGDIRSVNVEGFFPGIRYFFSLRSLDEYGNPSSLSNLTSGVTTGAKIIYMEDFENELNGWEIKGTGWDQATSPGLAKSGVKFLDHAEVPGGYIEDDSVISPSLDLKGLVEPYLVFSHIYEFYGIDRLTNEGIVEIQIEGEEDWNEIFRVKIYYAPWKNEYINIGPWREKKVRIRFRFSNIFLSTEDHDEIGWRIDDMKIIDAGINPAPYSLLLSY